MKQNRIIVVLIVGVIVLGAAVAFPRLQGQSQDRTEKAQAEEATRIHEGQMTEKQRQHAKLFKHSGRKLRDIGAGQTGEFTVEESSGLVIRLPETTPRPPVFQSAVCNADAVLVGTINNKSSQLTEEGNFIFTDYEITVEEVIKDNAAVPIQKDDTIVATRDGGAIRLDNRILRAKRDDFDPPLVGQRYLLFLRFIPVTGSYLTYGNGTFQLKDQNILALGPGARDELSKHPQKNASTFLEELRSFAGAYCSEK